MTKLVAGDRMLLYSPSTGLIGGVQDNNLALQSA